MKSKIIFFAVRTPKEKLHAISAIAHEYFFLKKKLFLFTPDAKAASFINEYLWKEPHESFLPHNLEEAAEGDLIIITSNLQPLLTSSAIFNLTSSPLEISNTTRVIYELDDQTTKLKKENSEKKFASYQDKRLPIETRKISSSAI